MSSKFVDLLRGRVTQESREANLSVTTAIAEQRLGGAVWAGVSVSEMRALQLLTVYSCVSLITDVISSLPVDVLTKTSDRIRRPVDPAPAFFQQPHAEQSWPEWIGRGQYSLLMRGDSFGRVIERDRRGVPLQIFPHHPDEVSVRRNRDTGKIEYRIGSEKEWLPRSEMLHVKGLMRPGRYELTGLSPIANARQALGLALAAQEYGARYFGESANPSSVLETDESLEQDEVDEILARWEKRQAERHRRPAVTAGGLKYRNIAIAPNEAQFLETRKFSRSEICGLFRCPPHMVMDVERSTSWGTGIEEQNLMFAQITLTPWLVRWETALSALLPEPQYVKFNLGALLRARLLERFQAHLLARQGGWENADEIRELEDMAPIPDGKGQDYLQPLNYTPVGESPPPKPAPTP
jgi:HK97 family phage portal protein